MVSTELFLLFWLFPVVSQIVLPLVIFLLWSVMKLPKAFRGNVNKTESIA